MANSITITFNDIHNYGKTLMLRGFAEFISWKHIKNSSDYHHTCIVQDLVKVIKAKKIETLVWDGDLYRSDSFTHLIFELMKKLPENTNDLSSDVVEILIFPLSHKSLFCGP